MFSREGYDALHSGTAWVRRSDRGVLRLSGADRYTWLQGLVTNDVLSIPLGARVYAAFLTPQGRMLSDVWVVPTAQEALLLDVPAPLAADLAARLDGLVFAEDVSIQDASATTLVVQWLGPAVHATVFEPATEAERQAVLANDTVAAASDRTYGVRSVVAYLPAAARDDYLRAVAAMSPPLVEVDLETFDVFRIERGVPRFLADMTTDTIPLEAGIEGRAISFTKGCYVGQEIIVRVTARGGGRVARRLVGLTIDGPWGADRSGARPEADLPAPGATILAGERAVGRVTSVASSPRLETVIALGYVHRDFVDPGTRLEVRHGEQSRSASVTELPFIQPSR